MMLANHTWWDTPHVLAMGFALVLGFVVGLVLGAVFLGARMVRVHTHGGFKLIATILVHHRRPPRLDEVQVAFDPELVEERNRLFRQLVDAGGDGERGGSDGD